MGTGTKRHRDDDAHAASEASSKRQRSYLGKKRKAQDDSGAKKRARAIERALRRNENLPADVRANLERELASQKQVAEDKAYRKKRSAMISRYHMVRFFERKKAARLAKQLRRKMDTETDGAELEKLRRWLHTAEVDEAYTQYFPHLETYVGLYSANAKSKHDHDHEDDAEDGQQKKKKKQKKQQTQKQGEAGDVKGDADADADADAAAAAKAALEAERPPMWSTIEIAMKEGKTALERLRDRRSPTDSSDFVYSRPPARPRPAAAAAAAAAPTREGVSRPAPGGKKDEKPGKHNKSAGMDERNNKTTTMTTTTTTKTEGQEKQPEMNRRERRRLMREAAAASKDADGDEDEAGGGFFEGL